MAGDYEVGYGKPPAKNKFKKGQSGNLKGRPKKQLDLQKLFIAELKSSVTITESGKKIKVSKLQALTKSIIVHAMQGNKNYAKFVLDWIKALPKYAFVDVDDGDEVVGHITAKQMKAMEDFMAITAPYAQEEAASSKEDND
jgi:hypothetical protein